MLLTHRIGLWALALTLGACGGSDDAGGSGGGYWNASTDVTMSPDPLTATWVASETRPLVLIASIDPPTSEALFPKLVVDRPVIQADATTIVQQDAGTFVISMLSMPALPPAVYRGTMTLRLCRDAACTAELALNGADVNYEFIVQPD